MKIGALLFMVCTAASGQPLLADPTPVLLFKGASSLAPAADAMPAAAPAPPVLNDLRLKYLASKVAADADRPLIIYLHGYGGSERSGAGSAALLPAGYTFLTVRAPLPLRAGYQWFHQTYNDSVLDGDAADVRRSTALLADFIAGATAKYRTRPDRVLVVGMSQGAMMAYAVALRHPDLLRGVAALSGAILPVSKEDQAPPASLQMLALFIGHGTADTAVPYARATEADATLRALGVDPTFHSYFGMKHETRGEEIRQMVTWMRTLFGDADLQTVRIHD